MCETTSSSPYANSVNKFTIESDGTTTIVITKLKGVTTKGMLISILSYSEHFEKQARNSKASDFRSFVTIACTFRNLLRSREVTINLKCDKNKYPGEMDGISIRGTTAVSSIVSLYEIC